MNAVQKDPVQTDTVQTDTVQTDTVQTDTVQNDRKPATGTVSYRIRVFLSYLVLRTASILFHRVSYPKTALVPRTGPVLLVPNHTAITETTAIARLVVGNHRFPHFLIAAGAFRIPVIGWLGRMTAQIPVERGSAAAGTSLELAAAELLAGHLVVLYPEGRISRAPDQRPQAARTGAARLALQFPDVPVVPVGQWGAGPGWRRLIRRQRVTISVGPPVDLSPWRGRGDREAIAEASEAIMAAITGQVEQARGERFAPLPSGGSTAQGH